jgi:hypothetical protein
MNALFVTVLALLSGVVIGSLGYLIARNFRRAAQPIRPDGGRDPIRSATRRATVATALAG